MVVNLMIASDENFKKVTNEKESRFIVSSESEADVTTSEKYALFKRIVDEYCSETGYISRSCKKAIDAVEDENDYRKFAIIFRKLEKILLEKAENCESTIKRQEAYARAMLSRAGQMSLRNGHSSSILERSFSDSLRSCSDRKVVKRNVFG